MIRILLTLLLIPIALFALDSVDPDTVGADIRLVYFSPQHMDTAVAVDTTWIQIGHPDSTFYNFRYDSTAIRCSGIMAWASPAPYYDNTEWTFIFSNGGDYVRFAPVAAFGPYQWVKVTFYSIIPGVLESPTFYLDTLLYRTAGETVLNVSPRAGSEYGFAATGTSTIRGIRSAGMTVKSSKYGTVVTPVANDTTELRSRAFTFTWSGLEAYEMDSMDVWGISDAGASSDTITIYRYYRRLGFGVFDKK